MSYYDKYIKYKQKYISLKNQSGGMFDFLAPFVPGYSTPAPEYNGKYKKQKLNINDNIFDICGKIVIDNTILNKYKYKLKYECDEINNNTILIKKRNADKYNINYTQSPYLGDNEILENIFYKDIEQNIDNLPIITSFFSNSHKSTEYINYFIDLEYISLTPPDFNVIKDDNKTILEWTFNLDNEKTIQIKHNFISKYNNNIYSTTEVNNNPLTGKNKNKITLKILL